MAFKMNGWSAFKQPKENVETFSINPNDAQLKIFKDKFDADYDPNITSHSSEMKDIMKTGTSPTTFTE